MAYMKAKIDGVIYDVVPLDEYNRGQQLNQNPFNDKCTAVICDEFKNYVLPIRNFSDYGTPNQKPGVYHTKPIDYIVEPDPSQTEYMKSESLIDFSDSHSLRDIIEKQQELNSAKRTILTSIDNEFVLDISGDETPEMNGLKESVNSKHIDIAKYEPEFGDNYNNDKRVLTKDSITFGKLRTICKALDIKATITFEDENPDVPNPIGKVITRVITGNSDDESQEGDEN